MVSSIGGTSAAQAIYATRTTSTDKTASTTAAAAPEVQETAPAATQSTESAAAARLGDQLGADADAARVQRAVDESASAVQSGESETSDVADVAGEEETQATEAAAGGAAPAGRAGGAGGASASSETTETDYIAEADTNSDKTVSDEERAVYEAKLRKQAEQQASESADTAKPQDQTASVRAAYGQDEAAAPALDITA